MLRYIGIFFLGLMIGTAFPNEIRSVIYYGLSYIESSIKVLQDSLSTPVEEKPYRPQALKENYKEILEENKDIIKNLDPDWR